MTKCNCILLPQSFHSVTTCRASYESISLELFPLYSCELHRVSLTPPLAPTVTRASPYKLVRFDSSGSIIPLISPGQKLVKREPSEIVMPLELSDAVMTSSKNVIGAPASVSGATFRNTSTALKDTTDSVSVSVPGLAQFTNLS